MFFKFKIMKKFSDQFTNQYSLSKTLRFELKPQNDLAKNLKDVLERKENINVDDFLNRLKDIQKFFLEIFISNPCSHKQNDLDYLSLEFVKNRKVKYGWFRNYTKSDFYDWKEKNNKDGKDKEYDLTEIDYLPKEFLRWLNEWQSLTSQFEEFLEKPEESQNRRREMAFIIRSFSKKENFEFIREFSWAVCNTNKTEIDSRIQEFVDLISITEIDLKKCENLYLPFQSAGLKIAKASFNYFTLNKDSNEYGDLEINKTKLLKERPSQRLVGEKIEWFYRDENNKIISLFSLDKIFLEKINVNDDIKNANNIESLYSMIKKWKAEQKSKFNEAVAGDKLTVYNFRKEFPLFDTINENFEKFYELTKKLDFDPERGKEIAQERGEFFNAPKKIVQTQNYKDLCELYKKVALARGQILAEIRGLEYEKVDAKLLAYWSLILKEDNKKYLVLIPRSSDDNHKKARKFVEGEFKNSGGEITLYHFKSLTLRALEKLCFKKFGNTFRPKLEKAGLKFPQYKEKLYENEIEMIKFYQNVLLYEKNKIEEGSLDLIDFGDLSKFLDNNFDDLKSFESELEKSCYVKIPLNTSIKQKNDFIEKFDAKVFEITTQSIEGKKKENRHVEIWRSFWSDENKEENHVTRLNPEMSIFYREALDKRVGLKNRYSEERFTLATTITLNATNKKSNLAFKTTQDIKDHIDEFNDDYKVGGEWFYGIDRGLKELATLNVVKFSGEKNEFGSSQSKEFAKIKIWKIKDLNKSKVFIQEDGYEVPRIIGNNPSYFFTDDGKPDSKFFEDDIVSSIDLTQAKLIKGHIILNGDSKTYLKLKEVSAKRRIFELFSTSRIDKDSEIEISKSKLTITKFDIYWFTSQQKRENQQTKIKEEIKKSLKEYLEDLDNKNKFQDIETIEKINHLRDAITANMVGIIAHLQKELKGFIALENLDTIRDGQKDKMIDEHFSQSNEDISRRLEWALYRKFANTGDVPPQIKQSIILRDDFKVDQMGIIKFVKVGGTSSNCPNCKKESGKTNGHFVCEYKENNCDFDSRENKNLLEENLSNSDEVAAYNVAKNAFEKIYE